MSFIIDVTCGNCGAVGNEIDVTEGKLIRKYYRYDKDHPNYLDDFVDGVHIRCTICGYEEGIEN